MTDEEIVNKACRVCSSPTSALCEAIRLARADEREKCERDVRLLEEWLLDNTIRRIIENWKCPEARFAPRVQSRPLTEQEEHALFHAIKTFWRDDVCREACRAIRAGKGGGW